MKLHIECSVALFYVISLFSKVNNLTDIDDDSETVVSSNHVTTFFVGKTCSLSVK